MPTPAWKKFWQYNMSFDHSLSGCRLEFVTTQKLVGGLGHISNVEFWEQTSCLFWAYLFLSLWGLTWDLFY